ncbi:hypothetical protein [Paludibaculum fermentans]|uniref:hypothetical protein n=1 Tax=Paludibaculum fermentans TaxID=1473598 RepID=UPI003EB9F70F
MAFNRFNDEGEETAAWQHFENAPSGLRRAAMLYRQMVYIEAACASASIRKNPERARQWRQRATALMKPRALEAVNAEIAITKGRFEAALKHLEAFEAHLDKCDVDSGQFPTSSVVAHCHEFPDRISSVFATRGEA